MPVVRANGFSVITKSILYRFPESSSTQVKTFCPIFVVLVETETMGGMKTEQFRNLLHLKYRACVFCLCVWVFSRYSTVKKHTCMCLVMDW